jgi:hypothetical protein
MAAHSMPPAPESHAEISASTSGDDQAQRISHLQDCLERAAKPPHSLQPVCFQALTAAASRNANGPGPLLTFGTHNGKSLQIMLRIPPDQSAGFITDLLRILPGSPLTPKRGRRAAVAA